MHPSGWPVIRLEMMRTYPPLGRAPRELWADCDRLQRPHSLTGWWNINKRNMVLLRETLSSAVKKQPQLLIGTFLDLRPPCCVSHQDGHACMACEFNKIFSIFYPPSRTWMPGGWDKNWGKYFTVKLYTTVVMLIFFNLANTIEFLFPEAILPTDQIYAH